MMTNFFANACISRNVLDDAWAVMLFDLAASNTEQHVLLFSRCFYTKVAGTICYTPSRAASYPTEPLVNPDGFLSMTNMTNSLPQFWTQRSFDGSVGAIQYFFGMFDRNSRWQYRSRTSELFPTIHSSPNVFPIKHFHVANVLAQSIFSSNTAKLNLASSTPFALWLVNTPTPTSFEEVLPPSHPINDIISHRPHHLQGYKPKQASSLLSLYTKWTRPHHSVITHRPHLEACCIPQYIVLLITQLCSPFLISSTSGPCSRKGEDLDGWDRILCQINLSTEESFGTDVIPYLRKGRFGALTKS